MKYTGLKVGVFGMLLMIAVGCGSSTDDANAGETGGGSVGNIEQVELGMTEQQVVDLLGEEMGTSENSGTGENGLIYSSDDNKAIMIWFKDGKVSRVKISE